MRFGLEFCLPFLILHCSQSLEQTFFFFFYFFFLAITDFPHFKIRTVPSNRFPLISQMDSIGFNAFDDDGVDDDDDVLWVSVAPTHFHSVYVLLSVCLSLTPFFNSFSICRLALSTVRKFLFRTQPQRVRLINF